MSHAHAADEAELVVSTDNHVRLLRLNRPERRNALSRSLMVAIIEAMLDAEEDDEVRVVVLTGTGDAAFCAGGDLKEMRGNDEAGARFRSPMNRLERNVFEVVLEAKKPTIAALNASAVAGGFELALACDLRISHPGARFGLPETKIGMGANFGSVLLPRRVAPGIALEMLFTGEYIDAAEAYRIGLLNRVVDAAQVLPAALELAGRIAGNAPISVRRVKAVALRGLELPVAAALRQDPGANPYLSEDRKEGIRARLEKRKPVWRNR
ncbi:enoyl-CoA hydratase/isomerase family protein [Pigmentiphaga kullae]|uniref:Enoyl-CoA hydratase n=1 Tax=Pigmentiphaga kullae TaxID=151784 RepID=A0A4Q7NIA5_9BURK|nr:enoyl-CoA hydratase/isomerase family protein [Pigmentiphaga kullae]RZS84616.1 enoyl-CoA hydratase [Pigmentiphaga kullae]